MKNNDFQDIQLDLHDQLPSVEEIQTTHVVQRPSVSNRNLIVGSALLSILVFSATIMGVVMEKRKHNSLMQTESERQNDIVKFLSQYSDPDALIDPSKPQFQASRWLAFEDDKRLPLTGTRFLQRYALIVLYYATGGEKWLYNLNFVNPDRDECHWNDDFNQLDGTSITMGVECNADNQVQSIFIEAMGLTGILPPELSLLTHLKVLSLDNNSLSGALPVSLHSMTQLESLQLKSNNFATQVPKWLGNLHKLRTLVLSNNNFRSTMPTELEKMTSLTDLTLNDNALSGNLDILGSMNWLKIAYLQDNQFDDALSDAFLANLTDLKILNLSNNYLQGTVPRHLLHTLQVLDLHGNSLNGGIPENLPHSTSLQVLRLSKNKMAGSIPTNISNLSNLQRLDVSMNAFHGSIPTTLGNLEKMTYLNLADNDFDASVIPSFLQRMTLLSELSVKNTHRVGTIPTWLGTDLQDLNLLDLDDNALTGSIPRTIASLGKLEYLLLSRNKLTGGLPTEMILMSRLSIFLMEKNTITGSAGDVCGLELSTFVADCTATDASLAEFSCPCCTRCCPTPQCSDAWLNNIGNSLIMEQYDRRSYQLVPDS